jgi:hypothetical protein
MRSPGWHKLRQIIKRAGYPGMRACLVCGKLRLAQSPGDRLHQHCAKDQNEARALRRARGESE